MLPKMLMVATLGQQITHKLSGVTSTVLSNCNASTLHLAEVKPMVVCGASDRLHAETYFNRVNS